MTVDRTTRNVRLEDGRLLRYDRLLLATGARPRHLAVPGASLEGVQTLRTVEDADAIRAAAAQAERIVVIGGGWIGAEVAASLRQMDRAITLVTDLASPLQRVLGPGVAGVYGQLHRDHGVELAIGRVTAIEGTRRVTGVRLAPDRLLPAELVVAGVGVMPRVELARRSGLDVADGGIAVDAELRTSDPAIYAAGDVAAAWHPRLGERLRIEHWDNARGQGPVAARNILGASEPYGRFPYFYSDQFDLGMEYRGYAPEWDEVVIRGDTAAREFLAFWLREGRVIAAMNANIWDAGEQLAELVERRVTADPRLLADPGSDIGTSATLAA